MIIHVYVNIFNNGALYTTIMNGETRASVSVIIVTAIILTLPLLVVGNPVLFIINAESASAIGDSLTVSRSTALNPLGDTVLTLNDGTKMF